MSKFDAVMDRDANYQVLTGDYPFRTKHSITFAGGTTDAWGDDGGALDGGAIFTVTGLVKVKVLGLCTALLTGGATIEVGITGNTAIFCAQITDTVLDADEIWLNDTTPASSFIVGEEEAAIDNFPPYLLNGNDIIFTVSGAQNVTAGVVDFYALWKPLSDDGSITAPDN